MEVNNRLKALRVKTGLTQKELGTRLNVSSVSVRHWEAGTKKPSMSAIISLSKIFSVSTDYLLGVDSDVIDKDSYLLSKSELELVLNYRVLDNFGKKIVNTVCSMEKSRVESITPSVSAIADLAHLPKQSDRYIPKYITPSAAGLSVPLDGDDYEMILVDDSVPNDADFAVVIQGNSMHPYIQDGDIVYVKRDSELSIGDVGIFCVNGAMYCKQYYIDTNRNLSLISANPDLQDTNIYVGADEECDVRCYGKVLINFRIELPDYIKR